MVAANENLPEVAHPAHYPEAYNPPNQYYHESQHHRQQDPWSPQESTVGSAHPLSTLSYTKTEDYQSYPQVVTGQDNANNHDGQHKRNKRTILGCAPIVFLLSVVIAFLSALVIGLAAGTGVATSNYKSEKNKVQDLQASYSALVASKTTSATDAHATRRPSYSKITNGCSDENESTTGTLYKPDFFGKPYFTMYCNKDAANTPFYSLFTADFNGCMSACASWNSYNKSSSVCEGVSFIPLWSDVFNAVQGRAPGDCYLKPGPQSIAMLQKPNIGTECHAAILKQNLTSKS